MSQYFQFDLSDESLTLIRSPAAKFQLGEIMATRAAMDAVPSDEILCALLRHQSGDWGEIPERFRAANNQGIAESARLLSAYKTDSVPQFFVLTESDRSKTTVLLPDDF